jgi:hypothetical protein
MRYNLAESPVAVLGRRKDLALGIAQDLEPPEERARTLANFGMCPGSPEFALLREGELVELSARLATVGLATGEKVWRMPMGAAYDKLIDSKFADMKNTGGRYAGSITAAQFLKRFVGETPWAHLDIAGTAMGSPESDINKSWGSGWGVRLLDRLVAEHYEG